MVIEVLRCPEAKFGGESVHRDIRSGTDDSFRILYPEIGPPHTEILRDHILEIPTEETRIRPASGDYPVAVVLRFQIILVGDIFLQRFGQPSFQFILAGIGVLGKVLR